MVFKETLELILMRPHHAILQRNARASPQFYLEPRLPSKRRDSIGSAYSNACTQNLRGERDTSHWLTRFARSFLNRAQLFRALGCLARIVLSRGKTAGSTRWDSGKLRCPACLFSFSTRRNWVATQLRRRDRAGFVLQRSLDCDYVPKAATARLRHRCDHAMKGHM